MKKEAEKACIKARKTRDKEFYKHTKYFNEKERNDTRSFTNQT